MAAPTKVGNLNRKNKQEESDGDLRFSEFNFQGTKVRFVCTEARLLYSSGKYYFRLEKQVEDENSQFEKIGEDIIIEIDNQFIETLSENSVDADTAIEEVDDLENEILDETDPQNPVSFVPPKYQKKKQLKSGYKLGTEFFKEIIETQYNQAIDWAINDYANKL